MSDGSVVIDTSLDNKGLEKGIDNIGGSFNIYILRYLY